MTRRLFTGIDFIHILRSGAPRGTAPDDDESVTEGVFGIFALWCGALSAVDLRERRLPNSLTGFGALAVLGYALVTGRFLAAVTGAALLVVPYLLIHVVAPAAFGAGDVKLAVGLGAATACGGGRAWACAAVAAPVLTALIGALAVGYGRIRGSPANRAVPHGPSMCATALLALVLV